MSGGSIFTSETTGRVALSDHKWTDRASKQNRQGCTRNIVTWMPKQKQARVRATMLNLTAHLQTVTLILS